MDCFALIAHKTAPRQSKFDLFLIIKHYNKTLKTVYTFDYIVAKHEK